MGKLFGGGSSQAAAPTPTPVTRMPDEEDPAIKEARRKAAVEAQSRSGRASTVLTSRQQRSSAGNGQPGTQAYGNSLLGQAN
ncbi:hypothetical protein [Rhizobium sp. BK251]|uniref:hypothetical protein n=1 Tax=Rhizobium sp. BK251 TaxID=2512125 RepID=UPI001045F85C|nr:hypothetical protein [Rhizobium sp. BK251]TCL70639.1 hypothetical protein EV286_107517 [Rhizobium sp. BK251]